MFKVMYTSFTIENYNSVLENDKQNLNSLKFYKSDQKHDHSK